MLDFLGTLKTKEAGIIMRHRRFISKVFFAVTITLGALGANPWAIIADGKSTSTDVRIDTLWKTTDVAPVPLGLSIAPAIIVGGNQATATITLSTPAPTGGIEITLRSLNSAVARFGGAFGTIGTSQLRIPAGSLSATVPVRSFGVVNRTDVTLQALSLGETASATVTVKPASVKTLTIAPGNVIGGVSATGTITLNGLAPAGAGVLVPLSVARPTAGQLLPFIEQSGTETPAVIPSSVTVAPGASMATFVVNTNPVAVDTVVTLSAAPLAQTAGPPAITDGTSNTVQFGESAPATIASFTVSSPLASQLLLNPQAVPGGASLTGTVVLSGKAPAPGATVGLSTSSTDVSVPISFTIPPGADRQDFQITTHVVDNARTITIAVFTLRQLQLMDGSVRQVVPGSSSGSFPSAVTASLSLTPSLTISAQPSPATGGAPVAITLTVQPDPASSTPLALTTDHPEVLQVPATVAVPAQTAAQQKIIVNAPTNATTADQTVAITATRGAISVSTTLLIKQTPPPISSFTLRPATVHGGANIISQLTLSSTAPSSVVVSLTTDHPELVTVPATVTIARSTIPSSLTFRTAPVTTQTTVTITASTGAQTTSVTVNVVP